MKIAEINTVDYGSTGKIMLQIGACAREQGHNVLTFSMAPEKRKIPPQDHIYYISFFEHRIHRKLAKITGNLGSFSVLATARLLLKLKNFNPDIVHLHNLHDFNINLPMLFRWLKRKNKAVVWTLHDCWSFTGHCPYFDLVNCSKWKQGCFECPSYKNYPMSDNDNSRKMWRRKRKWFCGLQNATIVTPSKWLADLASESFLREYSVKVINNGIDLSIFNTDSGSDWRRKHIEDGKKVVLGVAFDWERRKGLDVFLSLAERLDDDYQIVLVGTDDETDRQLPDNIISIHRTSSQQELAEIYRAADVLVNPTREDNFPTVNIEALACGTPVITFDTGGSPEIIDDTCGIVVPCDDTDAAEKAVRYICGEKPFSEQNCAARAENFNAPEKFKEYVRLYQEIIGKTV